MEILSQYKSSKNNEALLRLVEKSFPENESLQNGLQSLISKRDTWSRRCYKQWIERKRPTHTEQSIRVLNRQAEDEIESDNFETSARGLGRPAKMHYSNIVIKTRARWVGYNPLSNDYFTEAIELGSEIEWKDYIHLVIEDKQSRAIDLIKTIDNLLTEGVQNGLGESNWMKLWMQFARTCSSPIQPLPGTVMI